MTILMTGSRAWTDRRLIIDWFLAYDAEQPGNHILIEGGADGADNIASHIALALGWSVRTVRARWGLFGARAGLIRNEEMLDMAPDLVVGFHKGNSPGTAHCLISAKNRGLRVVEFVVD